MSVDDDKELFAALGFDPSWTIEEACKVGAISGKNDSPFLRWYAWQVIKEEEKAYNEGSSESLIVAVAMCAQHDLPMPDWLSKAFCRGFNKWVNYKVGTLDEAFDLRKRTHISTKRDTKFLKFAVPIEVERLKKSGMPVDDAMFEYIGENILPNRKISGAKIKNLYYSIPLKY